MFFVCFDFSKVGCILSYLKNLEIVEIRKKNQITFPCLLVKVATTSARLESLSGSNVWRMIWWLLVLAVVLVYESGFSREIKPIGCIYQYLHKEIYYKKLAHMISEAEKSRSRKDGGIVLIQAQRPISSRRANAVSSSSCLSPRAGENQFQGKDNEAESQFLLPLPFILVKSSTDWLRPFHIVEGSLLYSVY